MSDQGEGIDGLAGTYWYVPAESLLALRAVNTAEPVLETLKDQTVWPITRAENGYLAGISATNIGKGWSYNLMVGSVAPDDPEWSSLPGYPETGIPDLNGLDTEIRAS